MTSTTQSFDFTARSLSTSPLFTPTNTASLPLRAFAPSTWRAFVYHLVNVPLGALGFVYVVTAVSLGLSLAALIIGLFLGAALVLGARALGAANRGVTNLLLGTSIPSPVAFRRAPGFGGFLRSGLTDGAGWRAMSYMFVTFMTSIFSLTVSASFLAVGLGGATYGVWRRWLPEQMGPDGELHRGAQFADGYFIDTPARVFVYSVICAFILLFVWPAINNGLAKMQAMLAATLLGPTQASVERHELLKRQARSAESTALKMRSIERDLHDVTQAQLVAIAMKVGDAKERLAAGESPEAVLATLDSAHATSKDALTDLRGLVQGIHPASLNDGLATALYTLASSSAISVRLDAQLTRPVSPAVEQVAYYSVSELLTNAAKHSGVDSVLVIARTDADRLNLSVVDHGRGGAMLRGASVLATGLDGVADRVASVGGTLTLSSPTGGPTIAEVRLPLSLES
ncbi:sensor histidine kinase [Populibacterium corticicola]|uniref:histidine kinase n=1 Tax=Populibacterium corticicola TaxID=1812826 RepID=A0ABW5XGY9_9MICO